MTKILVAFMLGFQIRVICQISTCGKGLNQIATSVSKSITYDTCRKPKY
jgi:hypothetical protein